MDELTIQSIVKIVQARILYIALQYLSDRELLNEVLKRLEADQDHESIDWISKNVFGEKKNRVS